MQTNVLLICRYKQHYFNMHSFPHGEPLSLMLNLKQSDWLKESVTFVLSVYKLYSLCFVEFPSHLPYSLYVPPLTCE